MNSVFTILNLSMNLQNFFAKNPDKILLDPLSTAFRLAILSFDDIGTKISIANNSIKIQQNNILQGIQRWSNGDTKELLGNLHKPICLYLTYYNNQEFTKLLNNFISTGLTKLKYTYKKHNITEHCLQHYIKIIDTLDYEKEISETDKKYFELYDLWNQSDINICMNLLIEYSKHRNDSILKALKDLLHGKDELLRNIVIK